MKRAALTTRTTAVFSCGGKTTTPIEIREAKRLYQKLNHVHHNPAAAGFVEKEEDWLYSNTRNYHGLKG